MQSLKRVASDSTGDSRLQFALNLFADSTMFGFRSKASTIDAIFVLLRRMDLAFAQRNGQLIVSALDWQKAFDSVDPNAMLAALRRFGLPQHVLQVINAIYTDRGFRVAYEETTCCCESGCLCWVHLGTLIISRFALLCSIVISFPENIPVESNNIAL